MSSLLGMSIIEAIMSTLVKGNKALRLAITKSANLAIMSFLPSLCILTRTGSTVSNAGKIVTEKTKANITPIATKLPKSLNGGESEKFILKKPIAVVILVKKIGCKFILILRAMAVRLSAPCRIS